MTIDELIAAVRAALSAMTDDERVDFIDEVMDGYCHFCGSDILPCYCLRDD